MLKRYPIRVLRYFLFLVVLGAFLFGVMMLIKQTSWDMLHVEWGTYRAWVILAVFVGLPLVYPFFGYGARSVRGNLDEKRDVIERVLAITGFKVAESRPDRIIARAKGVKNISMLFKDRIEITPEGDRYIRIEGPKNEVVRLESRLRAFMNL